MKREISRINFVIKRNIFTNSLVQYFIETQYCPSIKHGPFTPRYDNCLTLCLISALDEL